MKLFIACLLLITCNWAYAVDMDAKDYNHKRAIALVDARFLGEREVLGLNMERYRIISDLLIASENYITVGVTGPGGECIVVVIFKSNGDVLISDTICEPGS